MDGLVCGDFLGPLATALSWGWEELTQFTDVIAELFEGSSEAPAVGGQPGGVQHKHNAVHPVCKAGLLQIARGARVQRMAGAELQVSHGSAHVQTRESAERMGHHHMVISKHFLASDNIFRPVGPGCKCVGCRFM